MPFTKRQQSIRLANTLLAAVGGAVLTAVVAYAYLSGDVLVSSGLLSLLLGFFWSINVAFILVIKIGWNLRFNEPALTLPQIVWAATAALNSILISQSWDGAFYLLALLTMVFGIFRVNLRDFNYLTVYIIVLGALVVYVRDCLFSPEIGLTESYIYWLTFSFCAFALSRLCASLMILRNRLREKNEALEDALKARSYFLANMSHEIRTPMNGVLGMLDIVLRGNLQADQKRYLSIAQQSAHGLLTIINDILDFSKIEAGKLQIEPIDFNVGNFVQELISTFSAKVQEKNLELILDISSSFPQAIHADPVRLRQILNNLLANALKFTQQGEVILSLSLEESDSGKSILWQVTDTGIGIEEGKQHALFESFTQADVSTTRVYGGTGLGLAICKQLSLLMGGDISVTSELGKGSTFLVKTPYVQAAVDVELSALDHDIGGIRILVVDDNLTNRLVLEQQLLFKNAVVTLFEKPQDALDKLTGQTDCEFDVAILDMQMPEMDGIMLARKIRQLPHCHSLALIILTSLLEELDRETLLELRINAHLNKPIQPLMLYQAVYTANTRPKSFLSLGELITGSEGEKESACTHINSSELNQFRLLLVEDNPTNQEVALITLESLGVKADVANNGLQAIEKLHSAGQKKSHYHLVLMDCQMPVLDGYAATQEIRQLEDPLIRATPIVAMTANAMQGDRERCLAAGMNDYVSKPIQIDILRKTLERWLLQSADEPKQLRQTEPQVDIVKSERLVCWDKEALLVLVRHKEERMLKLLYPFVERLPGLASEIIALIRAENLDNALTEIHALKGVSANLGGRALPNFLAETEKLIRANNFSDPSNWEIQFNKLVNDLNSAMKKFLDSIK